MATDTRPVLPGDIPSRLLEVAQANYCRPGESSVSAGDYLRRQLAAVLTETGSQVAEIARLHAPVHLDGPSGKFAICRHCCTWGEDRRRTRECEEGHGHGPGAPRCLTSVILEGGSVSE